MGSVGARQSGIEIGGRPVGEVEDRLKELGLELPEPPKPLAEYVPAIRAGDTVLTAGHVPVRQGKAIHTGRLGEDVTLEQGRECARLCALNALAAVRGLIGDLNHVQEVVQMRGFVASAPHFTQQPEVLDSASELMVQLFGDPGRHVRSAVGVSVLPRNVPVELELVVRVRR
jgi:enamine deaminase RidA (YjgF/YER057c/UK114 family)